MVDVDSFIGEVHGYQKQGVGFGYTKKRATARQWTLHLPARWPWQHDFIRALPRIRALPALV
ncbi:MAG: hypothetical protein JOY89_24225 [Solirubrobacterales bacterium]|nr:hypothetical protein [Solirubrobacterales bacterium]